MGNLISINKSFAFLTAFMLGISTGFAQNIRTFNTYELSSSPVGNQSQYAFFFGETLQNTKAIPFRISTGVQYSYNLFKSEEYIPVESQRLNEVTFEKTAGYGNFTIPVNLEFFYGWVGIGAYHDIISFAGKKKFNSEITGFEEGTDLRTRSFTSLLHQRKNLNGGVYVSLTFNDSFALRAGYTRLRTGLFKSKDGKSLGNAQLSEDTFNIGLKINIEK